MDREFLRTFIEQFYWLNRTAVSEETDRLVAEIQRILDCNVIEVPSGQECLTWFIPKHWKVREAWLARMDGVKVVDFHAHPLHLWTHSVPFRGEISRADLEPHLYFDREKPDWVPYHHRNGYRFDAEEWGFSLSYRTYQSLTDERYVVHIDTDLDTHGTMKVVDCLVPGENPETFFFAAHTCHPGQVTDGLSCIAVLVWLFRELRKRPNLRHSYRFIAGPEYFAAAGFLGTQPESVIATLKAGVYVDFLGNNECLGYQRSYPGTAIVDRVLANVFTHCLDHHVARDYRKIAGNDETFYNGCGFVIPTAGIDCLVAPLYHFDQDNPGNVSYPQLETAGQLMVRLIDVLETDYVPIPKFRGPLYLSRYNLYIDYKEDPAGFEKLEYLQILMDGKRSCFEIAEKIDQDFFKVRSFCDQLIERDLITKGSKNLLQPSTTEP